MARKKDFDYFQYFCDIADCVCNAAEYMKETLVHFDPVSLNERIEEIHKMENDADSKKHEMTQLLMHEFITPIEREDLIALAQEMDNVVDAIDDVMRCISMFRITSVDPAAIQFAELIVQSAYGLKSIMEEFKNFRRSKTIMEKVINVNTLEHEGDNLHFECIQKIFSGDMDTRDILIWTGIFNDMESCLDSCEDAADIIESVIMKNS